MKTKLLMAFILLMNIASAQWSRINNSPANAKHIYFYNPSLGYALKGYEIYKSADGGISWNNTLAGFSVLTSISDIRFSSPDTGFVSVTDISTFLYPVTIYRTIDGGNTWSSFLGPFNSSGVSFHLSGQNNWYFYLNSNGAGTDTVYHTTNGGSTWTKTPNATQVQYNQLINNLVLYKDSVAPSQANLMCKSTDGGATWNVLLTDNTATAAFVDYQFVNANTGYALLYEYNPNNSIPSKIYKTSNGGQTWVSYNLPAACSGPQNLHFTSTNTGYIVSNNPTQGALYKTTDGGQTWNPDFPAQASEYFALPEGVWEYFGKLYMLGNDIISNEITTSIKELRKDQSGFHVFPNPSTGQLVITSRSAEKDGHFVIMDLMGRDIHTFAMEQTLSQKIDLGFLQSGVYFLRNSETSQAILFVKE